jgi:hypothetical protein
VRGKQAQAEADARWQFYEQVAGVHRVVAAGADGAAEPAAADEGAAATPAADATHTQEAQ